MSREILFRAKKVGVNHAGDWVEGSLIINPGGCFITKLNYENYEKWSQDAVQVNFFTVCQYTGLEGADGNKIWENDIIMTEPHELDVGVVRYGKYSTVCGSADINVGFYIDWKKHTKLWRNDLGFWARHGTVQGNIFDTPELLEGGTGEDD